MSGKNSKVRGKSGFLTGLMIVSTGLIAGFHGFDLAMSERAVDQRVSALDQLVTASLDGNNSSSDPQGLANLIHSASMSGDVEPRDTLPANDFPLVNRALKRDRAFARTSSPEPIEVAPTPNATSRGINALIEAANVPLAKPKQAIVNYDAEQQELAAVDEDEAQQPKAVPAVLARTSLEAEIPFADSADIALFAADMPLPAKLTSMSRGNRVSLLSRAQGSAYNNRSPLVPRKLSSGKAFGGLAELAFQKRERRCMTTALYFEARSEPEAGQIAVGQVVMNRVRSPDYPDTICGVVYQGSHRRTGCQFSFTCDGKADKPNNATQWERSKRLANQVLEGKVWMKSIGNSTHYHANYVKPRWRRKMSRLKQIGRHIFYKSPNISVTETYQRYVSGKRS